MIINIAKTVLKRKCGVMMQIVLTVLRGVVRRLAFPPPPPTNVGGGWAGISHKPYNGARAPAFFFINLYLEPTPNPKPHRNAGSNKPST